MSAALFRDAVDVSPVRHAALALHGLAAADQAWVLARLPQDQQRVLQALLGELAELDPDRAVLTQADIGSAVQATLDSALLTDEERLQSLAGDDLDRFTERLSAAPAHFIALCLRLRPWPWHARMLERLAPTCRQQVRAWIDGASDGPPAGPRRQAALMRNLRRMVDTPPAPAAQPAQTPSARAPWRHAWPSWPGRRSA